ncbi:MAG: aminopeptidase P family protein [Rikenellaceae bacterium]
MFLVDTYKKRREELMTKLRGGVAIIPANLHAPNSYPNNPYYFRQDSTFRYFFGINSPALVGVMDIDSGETTLYGDDPTLDDLIWTGALPTTAEQAAECGVERGASLSSLNEFVARAQQSGREIHILPPYRGESKLQLAELLGCSPFEFKKYISADLIFGVAELREVKSPEEIAQMEEAYLIGYEMHTAAMSLTREGITEREVSGVLDGVARRRGGGVSFPTIYTQHGEILHNISQEGVLKNGRLVLCDAGAETLSGYCSDHTRTYPVSGRFSDVQRDIYNIVLEAHNHVAQTAKANMLYQDLHRAAQRKLAEGLKDFGLLRGSIEEIEESEAVRLFMPHGTGHGLGMDVHDCEAFGERSFDFGEYKSRAQKSGTCIFRDGWILREGAVITNEPGIYFIEALIRKSQSEGLYSQTVNYPLALSMCDFGGVRIEDDLIITSSGARQIGGHCPIPKSVEEIEKFMEETKKYDFNFPNTTRG